MSSGSEPQPTGMIFQRLGKMVAPLDTRTGIIMSSIRVGGSHLQTKNVILLSPMALGTIYFARIIAISRASIQTLQSVKESWTYKR